MLDGRARLRGNVDLPGLHPLEQLVRRQVNHLDLARPLEHRVRDRLAHPHECDLRDDVVQALDVLDVQDRKSVV